MQTDRHTYNGDYIGPLSFQPGTLTIDDCNRSLTLSQGVTFFLSGVCEEVSLPARQRLLLMSFHRVGRSEI